MNLRELFESTDKDEKVEKTKIIVGMIDGKPVFKKTESDKEISKE